jgi:hypothetical protein
MQSAHATSACSDFSPLSSQAVGERRERARMRAELPTENPHVLILTPRAIDSGRRQQTLETRRFAYFGISREAYLAYHNKNGHLSEEETVHLETLYAEFAFPWAMTEENPRTESLAYIEALDKQGQVLWNPQGIVWYYTVTLANFLQHQGCSITLPSQRHQSALTVKLVSSYNSDQLKICC